MAANSTTFKAADSKREEFRKYLEKAGVLDALTKVLVGLYESPEKPNNALDYLRQNMTTEGPETADVEALKTEVTDLRRENERLQEEINDLKARIGNPDPAAEENPTEN